MPVRLVLCAVLLAGACTAAPPEPPMAIRHVATPDGPAAHVVAEHGLDYEVSAVVRGEDARATLVVAGVVVAEERWIAGRYYQRSSALAVLLGDDRWLSASGEEVDRVGLGLRELAVRGGSREIEPGVVVELHAEHAPLSGSVVIEAPPASQVVTVADLVAETD